MVVDKRRLNSATVKDSYPMWNIENLLAFLKIFTCLELFSG